MHRDLCGDVVNIVMAGTPLRKQQTLPAEHLQTENPACSRDGALSEILTGLSPIPNTQYRLALVAKGSTEVPTRLKDGSVC